MKKVIFNGKEMEVLDYMEESGIIEVPLILQNEECDYCPLTPDIRPVSKFIQGDLIVCEDAINSEALVIWCAIPFGCLFAFHAVLSLIEYFK